MISIINNDLGYLIKYMVGLIMLFLGYIFFVNKKKCQNICKVDQISIGDEELGNNDDISFYDFIPLNCYLIKNDYMVINYKYKNKND